MKYYYLFSHPHHVRQALLSELRNVHVRKMCGHKMGFYNPAVCVFSIYALKMETQNNNNNNKQIHACLHLKKHKYKYKSVEIDSANKGWNFPNVHCALN